MQQKDFILWLQENYARLQQTSPKFFRVWNKINKVVLFFAGIPTILKWLQNIFDAEDIDLLLPGKTMRIILKIAAFCASYGLLIGKLTVKQSHEAVVTPDGVELKACDNLPFTEKKETEENLKKDS